MTYRELSKELGLSASKLQMIEAEGLLKSRGPAALLGNFDDEDVKIIRTHCLFSMLGVSDDEAVSIIKNEIDMKATLKKHVDSILSDDSNHTQAAIVLQNIRRECSSIDELDPVPFLQHIKELKHSGGLFYDVNSGHLDDKKESFGTQRNEKNKSFSAFLGGWMKGEESFRDRYGNSKSSENNTNEIKFEDKDNFCDNRDIRENVDKNGIEGTQSNTERDDLGKNQEGYSNQSYFSQNTRDEVVNSVDSTSVKVDCGGDNNTDNSNSKKYQTDNPTDSAGYDSRESTSQKSAGYDENWSPYTDRGFGASNLGSGNWQGWSAGYGTYAKPLRARERINNGEKTCPHPFRRFAARILDTTLVTLIGGAILRLGFRVNVGISLSMVAYCEIIFWLFEMMIEPLLLTTFGTTPGKFIMGIKIRDMKTKNKLELKQAYIRALKLAWQGFGFMIPIYTVFKRVMSFMRCKVDDTMPWDNGIDVELVDEAPARIALVIIAIVLLNVGDELVSKQALIPENRGELTSEQFYENVVELMKYTGYAGDIPEFELDIKGGYVKRVTLNYTSEQTDKNRYDEMYLGFLAFAGASDNSNGITLMTTSVMNKLKSYYADFSDSYGGVNILNTSDSEIRDASNYSLLYSMLYGTEATIPAFNQTFTMSK
ncbi:MAG: RDD family protein [Lachnospiraceae bacterium]|nr:RDD family protein [Lachnospiraceae bacterium]